jgi:hypothetical protein
MMKQILIVVAAVALAGSASSTIIQFGSGGAGNDPAAPDDGAISAVTWLGDYTNFNTAANSTANGTLDGQGAGATLINPLATLTMNSVFTNGSSASTADVWGNFQRAIGVAGGTLDDTIEYREGFEFSFDSDVNLEYLRFRAFNTGDEITVSTNGVVAQVMTSSFWDTSMFLAQGDILKIEGSADPTTAQLTSLVVDIIPEPATLGLMGVAGLGVFLARNKRQTRAEKVIRQLERGY